MITTIDFDGSIYLKSSINNVWDDKNNNVKKYMKPGSANKMFMLA